MGLDIKLYNKHGVEVAWCRNGSINWQEVEEGAEVRYYPVGNIFVGDVKFLAHIPKVKKIIVEIDGLAELVDEDKVELV